MILKFESVILNDMDLALIFYIVIYSSFNRSLAIFELLRLGVLLFLKCIVPVAFV